MGRRPSKSHSIDRKNGKRGYSPRNCRWATAKEQNRNTAANHRVTYLGETLTLIEWSEKLGFPDYLLGRRLTRMSVEEAFQKPYARRKTPKRRSE
jgi:hypothetical protein